MSPIFISMGMLIIKISDIGQLSILIGIVKNPFILPKLVYRDWFLISFVPELLNLFLCRIVFHLITRH